MELSLSEKIKKSLYFFTMRKNRRTVKQKPCIENNLLGQVSPGSTKAMDEN